MSGFDVVLVLIGAGIGGIIVGALLVTWAYRSMRP